MRGLPLAAAVLFPALALAAAPSVTARPQAVVLGNGTVVELKVAGDGGALLGFTSVGTLEHDEQLGATATFRFHPPDIRYPATALLLFWTQTGKTKDIAVVRIPLIGRTELKVSTEPRATVFVEVHDRKFGPVKADEKGNAKVPIEVPPSVRTARVLVDAGGSKSTREAKIDVPETNPLAVAFAAESFAADERGTLIVAHTEGFPKGLQIKVRGGEANVIDTSRDVAIYAVKAESGANDVTAEAKLGSFSVEARSTVRPAGTVPPGKDPAIAIWPFAGIGGFAAGGANLGPALVLGVGKTLRPNLTLEAETGVRTAGLTAQVEGLGTAHARLIGIPVQLGARLRLLQLGTTAVDGRAGVGLLVFTHSVSTNYQPSYTEVGVRPDGFLALSGSVKLGAFEPFVELRAQWGAVATDNVSARLGGVFLTLGARYAWR